MVAAPFKAGYASRYPSLKVYGSEQTSSVNLTAAEEKMGGTLYL
jgi:hypothetical protein